MADAEEEIPPLDAVPGWSSPEAQADWYGSAAAEEALYRAARGGRLHHAWLITGQKGVGKATLAFRFARFLLAGSDETTGPSLGVPPQHRVFRQVAAGAHPNVLTLRRPWDEKAKRYRTEVTIDEVRRTQRFFGSTAGEAGWRICVVDAADDLNPNAANAILKMLEEPPTRSVFLLLAHRPGLLLPTIRSRCRRLDLPPLPAETIRSALEAHGDGRSDDERRLAATLADGSLRRAILLVEGEGVSVYEAFRTLVAALPQLDYRGVHDLADRVTARGGDDAYGGFLDGALGWLSRRVRRLPEPSGGAIAPSIEAVPLASWAGVWEKVVESSQEAEVYNLDRKQVVLQVFMSLANAARM